MCILQHKDNRWDTPKPLWLSLAQFDKNKTKTLTGHENLTRNIWDLDPSGPLRRSLQQPSIPTQPQTNSEDFIPSEEVQNPLGNPILVQPAGQEAPSRSEGAQQNENEALPQELQPTQEQPFQPNKLVVAGQLNQLNVFLKVLNKNNRELLCGRFF